VRRPIRLPSLLLFAALLPTARFPLAAQAPPGASGSADEALAVQLASAVGDENRILVLRAGEAYVALRGDALARVEGDRVTTQAKWWGAGWPAAALDPAVWDDARLFEAARYVFIHQGSVPLGEAPLDEKKARAIYPKRFAEHVGEMATFVLSPWFHKAEEQFQVDRLVPDPLARPGDGPLPTDPKKAWVRTRLESYNAFGGTSAVVLVTRKSAKPARKYAALHIAPLANQGRTGLPEDLESAFLGKLAAEHPADPEPEAAKEAAAAGERLEVKMLLYDFPSQPLGNGPSDHWVSLHYTVRDSATDELLARGDGQAYVRSGEKHRIKDVSDLVELTYLPKVFE
jgi:hypothetical protein